MDEFLGSIHFNQNGDLLLSSSYLTFQHWIGFIGFLNKHELSDSLVNRKTFMLSSLATGKSIDSGVTQARWISNDKALIATDNGEVSLFKINKEPENLYENLMTKKEHDNLVLCLETNFNSDIALSGSEDSKIKVWNLTDEVSMNTLKGHDNAVCSLSFNPTCLQTFISCSEDNRAIIWDLRKETPAYSISHKFKGHPSASAWSRVDSNQIALGSENGQLGVFDVRTLRTDQKFALIKSNDRYIRHIAFNPVSNLIATASEDCSTQVYKLISSSVKNESGLEKLYDNRSHIDYVTDVAWHPVETNQYLTSSWDGTVKQHLIN